MKEGNDISNQDIITLLSHGSSEQRYIAVEAIDYDPDYDETLEDDVIIALARVLLNKTELKKTKVLILELLRYQEEKKDLQNPVFLAIRKVALEDANEEIRELAIYCLAGSHVSVIDDLTSILLDPSKLLRIAALVSLKKFDSSDALTAMIAAYQREVDMETKGEMLSIVANTRKPEVIPILAHAMQQENERDSALSSFSFNFTLDEDRGYDKKHIDIIVATLTTIIKTDPDAFRRKSAVDCFTYATECEEVIIFALQDKNEDVREQAIHCLRTMKANNAVKPLIDIYQSTTDIDLKTSIIDTLGSCKNQASFTFLVQTLLSEDSTLRFQAVEALEATWGRQIVEPLCQALDDDFADVRSMAAENLGDLYIYSPEDVTEADYSKVINRLSLLCESETVVGVKVKAMDALCSLCNHVQEAKISHDLSADIDKAVNIFTVLLNDNDPKIKARAMRVLGDIKPDMYAGSMVLELKNSDLDIQKAAAKALRYNKDTSILPQLVSYLQDESNDYKLRTKIAKSIGYIGNEEASIALLNELNNNDAIDQNSEQFVREGIVYGLRYYSSDAVVLALIGALEDDSGYVREAAALSLGAMNSDDAIEPLVKLFNDDYSVPSTRRSVVMALGSIDSCIAHDLVEQALGDSDIHVRETAQYILTSLKDGERSNFYNRGTLHYE